MVQLRTKKVRRIIKKGLTNPLNPNTSLAIKQTTFIKGVNLGHISKWKFIRQKGNGALFFKTPSGEVVVVRHEIGLATHPTKIGARKTGQPRRMLSVLNELIKRNVRMEIPLGEFVDEHNRVFYVTKKLAGITLLEFLQKSHPKEKVNAIAKSMGEELADLHKKGVVHNHPNSGNWLVYRGRVRLIDPKGVRFREEYPWTPRTSNNTYTFEELIQSEIKAAQSWLPEYAKKEFQKGYYK